MARAKRYQVQQKFWLNKNNEEQQHLIVYCEELRSSETKYSFASTIRNALRLIRDLRMGKLDVLFDLFPWVKAELLEYMKEIQPKPILPAPVSPEVKKYLQEILTKLDQPQTIPDLQPVGGNSSGLKQLGVPQFTVPVFDDDDDDDLLVVEKDTSSNKNVALNFIRSMQALQQ